MKNIKKTLKVCKLTALVADISDLESVSTFEESTVIVGRKPTGAFVRNFISALEGETYKVIKHEITETQKTYEMPIEDFVQHCEDRLAMEEEFSKVESVSDGEDVRPEISE